MFILSVICLDDPLVNNYYYVNKINLNSQDITYSSQDALKMLQEAPKMVQEAPKRVFWSLWEGF